MTFDNLVGGTYPSDVYTENGITVVGNGELWYGASYAIHLDDFGSSAPSRITFTMGGAFNAISLDVVPASFFYYLCDPFDYCAAPTYDNVLIQGIRGGSVAASMLFNSSTVPWGGQTMGLGSGFFGIDALTVSVFLPASVTTGIPAGYTWGCGLPCSDFEVDNVTLAPIPLPGALPLAAMGLGLLAMTARRRYSSRSA